DAWSRPGWNRAHRHRAARWPAPRSAAAGTPPTRCRTGGAAAPPENPAADAMPASCAKQRQRGADPENGEQGRESRERDIERAAAPRRPFAGNVAQSDGRVDGDGNYEHEVEREEPAVVARAAQNLGGGDPAAHRVDDGRQMDRHGDREDRGACAL